MRGDDGVDEGQSETCAAGSTGARVVATAEPSEDPVDLRSRYPWPIVAHSQCHAACSGCEPDGDLATSESRSGSLVTITETLNGIPTFTNAITCGGPPTTGGLWGAEFWAAAAGTSAPAENFYIAYRDNPPDGPPRVEAGRLYKTNAAVTSLEFDPKTLIGTLGGTCLLQTPPPSGSCTISMIVDVATLGVKPGAGVYSITGLSTYQAGTASGPLFTRLALGNSEQADAATAFDDNGTGTTK